MPAPSPSESQESSRDSPRSTAESDGPASVVSRYSSTHTNRVSRREFVAGSITAISLSLAGCSGRSLGTTDDVDVATRTDGATILWDYPARAVENDDDNDGIGYAAIRLRAFDTAGPEQPAEPVLTFRLNSTVGGIAAGEGFKGYEADWFRFRLGIPRSYDDLAGLRAFVHPNQWPEIQTTYGYHNSRRDLVVHAPEVHSDGTITVAGRFRPSSTALPRQLYCGFEVRVSRPGLLGRSVTATGAEMFDISTLDLPSGVTLE